MEEPEQWTWSQALYLFLLRLSRTSHKMPHLLGLADKAPVMQATSVCSYVL